MKVFLCMLLFKAALLMEGAGGGGNFPKTFRDISPTTYTRNSLMCRERTVFFPPYRNPFSYTPTTYLYYVCDKKFDWSYVLRSTANEQHKFQWHVLITLPAL